MNREIPHPPIETDRSDDFDDSPYAETNKGRNKYKENLKDQRKDISEIDKKQQKINENAKEFLKRLNKIPPHREPGEEPKQQNMFK